VKNVYVFDRYLGRRGKMAQGARIEKAASLKDALQRAARLFNYDGSDFVLRETFTVKWKTK
jgi:hypothetical protein